MTYTADSPATKRALETFWNASAISYAGKLAAVINEHKRGLRTRLAELTKSWAASELTILALRTQLAATQSAPAAVVPRLHHHDDRGARLPHGRFGTCWNCEKGWPLHDAPTLNPQLTVDPDEEMHPPQTCPSCGAEHPGERCSAYDGDLFGGDS